MRGNKKQKNPSEITVKSCNDAFDDALVSESAQESTKESELKLPSSPSIHDDINDYKSILIALHNEIAYNTTQRVLKIADRKKDSSNNDYAILLERVSEKDTEQDKKKNACIRSDNQQKLKFLATNISSKNTPIMLALEGNLNASGSDHPSDESMQLIRQTLQLDPDAVIIIITENTTCAKLILQMFPNHHVYYKNSAQDPFGTNNADTVLNERCFTSNIPKGLKDIAQRTTATTSDVMSPSSVTFPVATSDSPAASSSPNSYNSSVPNPLVKRTIRINPHFTSVSPTNNTTPQPTTPKSGSNCYSCFPWFNRQSKNN